MSETREIRIGNWIAGGGIIAAALVGYGFLQSQVSNLEKQSDTQASKLEQSAAQLSQDEKSIAVLTQQLTDIQQTVHDIDQRVQEDK